MTHLIVGEPAPLFAAATFFRSDFAFGSVGGRYSLLAFLPTDAPGRSAALDALTRHRELFQEDRLLVFPILRDRASVPAARDEPGLIWFFDPVGEIARLYGALSADGIERPMLMLIDPSLRIMMMAPMHLADEMLERLRRLPQIEAHAGVPLHAPVLIVPRVFERDMCRRLIAHYEAVGGHRSGVMREINGKTVGVLDDFKRRRDADIPDQRLRAELRARIGRRLLPEIVKAFTVTLTRVERYIVACYDADEGGYFRPHRDNTTPGTAHRRFAVSINLNAEDFEGGDLRFPEFGPRTYRPPTGGAVVFACGLLHEATPVTRGTRYAFLPFLYDEAGEAVRRRNLHLVQNAPTS